MIPSTKQFTEVRQSEHNGSHNENTNPQKVTNAEEKKVLEAHHKEEASKIHEKNTSEFQINHSEQSISSIFVDQPQESRHPQTIVPTLIEPLQTKIFLSNGEDKKDPHVSVVRTIENTEESITQSTVHSEAYNTTNPQNFVNRRFSQQEELEAASLNTQKQIINQEIHEQKEFVDKAFQMVSNKVPHEIQNEYIVPEHKDEQLEKAFQQVPTEDRPEIQIEHVVSDHKGKHVEKIVQVISHTDPKEVKIEHAAPDHNKEHVEKTVQVVSHTDAKEIQLEEKTSKNETIEHSPQVSTPQNLIQADESHSDKLIANTADLTIEETKTNESKKKGRHSVRFDLNKTQIIEINYSTTEASVNAVDDSSSMKKSFLGRFFDHFKGASGCCQQRSTNPSTKTISSGPNGQSQSKDSFSLIEIITFFLL